MSKILQFAVAIVAALWFTSDAFPHENKHSSNLEEFDFYFDDKSLKESTQHSNPLNTEATEFNKNDEHESINKSHSEDADEHFSVRNLKRLIRYYVSLLHSINETNSRDADSLQDDKLGKEPFSRNTKLETNRTNSTPRIYKSFDTENVSDAEFENSGGGNDSEYYEEGNSFKNSYKEESRIKTLKSNMKRKPKIRNNGRISGDQQRNSDDNQKLTSENFRFNRHSANHSASRTGQVSDEFIDEYINPPTEKVSMKSDKVPVTNQPIFTGNETVVHLKESPREENVSKVANRKWINPQNSDSDNISMDMKTTLNKGVGKEEFPRNDCEKSDNTNHKTFSYQTADRENKNFKEIAAVENTQNNFPSNKSSHFISNKPQNNKNSSSTSLSEERTSKILNVHSSSPEETELFHSQKPKISSVRKDAYNRSPKNFSVLDDSPNIPSLKENIQSPEPQMQSNNTSDKPEKVFSQQPLNSTKIFAMPRDFNRTNRLLPRNSSTDTEQKNYTGEPNERHLVKHPKLEENETMEFSYASEGLKIRTDSNAGADSSESNDSDADHWTQMQSESTSNKTEEGSSQQPPNSTKSFTMPGECNKTNRLLSRNSSTDSKSNNDTDIPSEKHSKLEGKENREFSNASQESKLQTDLDTDSDSSEYSDSEELLPRNTGISPDTESKTDTSESIERHFVKNPKLEEKETKEFSYASEDLKIRTDSNAGADSSESNDSDADHWTQMQSESTSNKTEEGSSQQPPNSTKSFTMPGECNKTNRLLSRNSSTDSKSNNDTDIPSEQHPKLEGKENREFSNASQESKLQTDLDTDSNSSEYSDFEALLYEYYEYDDDEDDEDDEDVQLMSSFVNYLTGTFTNATTQSSENFTAPVTNYSMEIELPTSSRNDSKINAPHETQGLYNSILEFLYKYSNSTWIKRLKEENRRM